MNKIFRRQSPAVSDGRRQCSAIAAGHQAVDDSVRHSTSAAGHPPVDDRIWRSPPVIHLSTAESGGRCRSTAVFFGRRRSSVCRQHSVRRFEAGHTPFDSRVRRPPKIISRSTVWAWQSPAGYPPVGGRVQRSMPAIRQSTAVSVGRRIRGTRVSYVRLHQRDHALQLPTLLRG
jgi:hypothetical protein